MTIQEILKQDIKNRPIFKDLAKIINEDEILLIMGARQIGKTYSLFWLIQFLVNQKKINQEQVLYFDLESMLEREMLEGIDLLKLENFLKASGFNSDKKIYLFLDEIQYLENPSNFLKLISDHKKNIKVICSGSSSWQIKQKFKDSLAGRIWKIHFLPLNFYETLEFSNSESNILNYQKSFNFLNPKKIPQLNIFDQKLKLNLENFLNFGGHPKVNLTKSKEKKIKEIIKIFDNYVNKDIKDFGRIEKPKIFNNLIKLLALQIGSLVNIQELCQSLKANRETIEKYLFLLENTFILHSIQPFFKNRRKEVVKASKIFFEDLGFRNIVLNNFSKLDKRADIGQLYENYIFNELHKNKKMRQEIFYWRTQTGQEVDFVVADGNEILPIEVKAKNYQKAQIPLGLKAFILEYSPKIAIVVNSDFFSITKLNNTKVYFVPIFLF